MKVAKNERRPGEGDQQKEKHRRQKHPARGIERKKRVGVRQLTTRTHKQKEEDEEARCSPQKVKLASLC